MQCPTDEHLARGTTPEECGAWLDHAAGCVHCHALALVLELPATVAAEDRIGRFVIARELGRGAMGVVYAAHDPELGRPIAIKVLHDRAAGERLRREARALARLDHPNVVRVYDAGVADERAFVAMELVAGETLRAWLATPCRLSEIPIDGCRRLIATITPGGCESEESVLFEAVDP